MTVKIREGKEKWKMAGCPRCLLLSLMKNIYPIQDTHDGLHLLLVSTLFGVPETRDQRPERETLVRECRLGGGVWSCGGLQPAVASLRNYPGPGLERARSSIVNTWRRVAWDG